MSHTEEQNNLRQFTQEELLEALELNNLYVEVINNQFFINTLLLDQDDKKLISLPKNLRNKLVDAENKFIHLKQKLEKYNNNAKLH